MGGGDFNHNKKNYSERRNHGLSLTNLTHCISPSEYYNDYYNNDSFNKINLQLHASSKVSNPYSFSIKSNTGFSGSVQATLPETKTVLLNIKISNDSRTKTFIVPAECKVVEAVITNNVRIFSYTLSNAANNIKWVVSKNTESVAKYIGVTPGKSYTLMLKSVANKNVEGAATVYYSAKINTHTPDVKDY